MLSLTLVLSTVILIPRKPMPIASTIPALKSGGDILTSAVDKVECLNKYFASVFTTENNRIPSLKAVHPSMDDIQVTTPGVFKLLNNLDAKKSSGPDDISPRVLKECASELAPVLTFLFNQSLATGIVPADWRDANVFALHKKGPKRCP